MMNVRMKEFREEMAKSREIPMVNGCVQNAEMLVHLEIGDSQDLTPTDTAEFNMLVIAKLFEAWKKVTGHGVTRPNHRWNCIESEINGDIMAIQWKDVPGTGF
jgi:hypothetical protein